jgi:hypothetical protein
VDQETSEIRADIARERRELGETVAALAEKADVKGQAHRKIAETRESIGRTRGRVVTGGQHAAGLDGAPGADQRRKTAVLAAGIVAGVLVLALLARR